MNRMNASSIYLGGTLTLFLRDALHRSVEACSLLPPCNARREPDVDPRFNLILRYGDKHNIIMY